MPIAAPVFTAAARGKQMLLHSMAPLHAAGAAAAQHAAVGAAPNAAAKKNTTSVPVRLDSRRAFLQGVVIAAAGAGTLLGHVDAAPAASKRRAPPPPAEEKEKKDPNMSGVQAKVMASRKRKQAMKEATEKLREKGKNPADAPAATTITQTQIKSAVVAVE